MSSQIAVNSIDALKDLRVALALYGEDTLAALGAVDAEIRRTNLWLQQDRPAYWQNQIKKSREQIASAKAELFRKKLGKGQGSSPSTVEQVENVRKAEARLQDAEKRLILTRKWQTHFQQAALEYHAATRRLKTQAAGEAPRGVNLLSRLIDALEAYIRVSPVSGSVTVASSKTATPELESIATKMIDDEPPADEISNDDSSARDDLLGVVDSGENATDEGTVPSA